MEEEEEEGGRRAITETTRDVFQSETGGLNGLEDGSKVLAQYPRGEGTDSATLLLA